MQRFVTATVLSLALAPALASAAGPPTWDKIASANSRFKPALSGAATLDKETGLVWETTPTQGVYRTFAAAQARCAGLVVGGRAGWRVPTIEELTSLAVPNPGAAFTYDSDYYWTATTVAGTPANAWLVYISGSSTVASLAKGNAELVWCVRGGHGYDGQ